MKQKLLEKIQATVCFHTYAFIFVWFYKKENGRQNRSSGAKTELLSRHTLYLKRDMAECANHE